MTASIASQAKKVQLQLPVQSVTSGISEWLDESIRVGHGERFAGAFKQAGAENLSDLHHIDRKVLERCLKDAGAKIVQLKQIWEVVDKALSCPEPLRYTPSNAGSRMSTPSLAACRTPSGMLDLQSPGASFFGENVNGSQKSVPQVSFCVEHESSGLPSLCGKAPKAMYFDDNCNAFRPCKSPMSSYFDGDGDSPSFDMDLQAPLSGSPQLLPTQRPCQLAPKACSGVPVPPPTTTHASLAPEPQSFQPPPLPTLLTSASFSGQFSPPMQNCVPPTQHFMQQQLQLMSIAWAHMMQDAQRESWMNDKAAQKQAAGPAAPQHRVQADGLMKRHSDTMFQCANKFAPAAPELQQHARMDKLDKSHSASLADDDDLAGDVSSLPVLGNVRMLSQHPVGCWRVQAYIADAADDAQRLAVASELRAHISEAAVCPHANHVLRKLINLLSPQSLQPFLAELVGEGPEAIVAISRHRYGCRIIEGLLIQCEPERIQPLIEQLLPHAYDLCMHMYGNFVMQKVVERGTENARQGVFRLLKVHLSSLGTSFYGSVMIGACMRHADKAEQQAIARALISVNGLLAALARFKHGRVAADAILGVLSGKELEEADQQLHDVTPLKAQKSKKAVSGAADACRS